MGRTVVECSAIDNTIWGKPEPFKQWRAQLGRERLEEIDDPELSVILLSWIAIWVVFQIRLRHRNQLKFTKKTLNRKNSGDDFIVVTAIFMPLKQLQTSRIP